MNFPYFIFSKRLAQAAFLMVFLLTEATLAQQDQVPQQLPITQLSAGIHSIKAMVASSPAQRQTGLMFRKDMGPNEGMLFVFETPERQCFWMKNTLLPLSAAFIADDGKIINVEDMKPQTLDSHCSRQPARFVLEMHQGWFAKRGLKEGEKLNSSFFTSSH